MNGVGRFRQFNGFNFRRADVNAVVSHGTPLRVRRKKKLRLTMNLIFCHKKASTLRPKPTKTAISLPG